MAHRLKAHHYALHYGLLFLLLATGFFAFTNLNGYSERQFQIGVVVILAYLCWGILHHLSDEDLNWKVMIEYAGISIFALSGLWALLFYSF